jgi:hypothetical protein
MALHTFGFVVTGAGLDPAKDRMIMASDRFRMIAVGVSDVADGPAVAQRLAAEGAQLIELCGGFGAAATAAVQAALGPDLPVGAVSYGPETIDALHALFSPSAPAG